MELWLNCWGERDALLAARRRCIYHLDLRLYVPGFPRLPSEPCLYSPISSAKQFVHPGTVFTSYREQKNTFHRRVRAHGLACDLRILFSIPFASFFSFTFCDRSLLSRLLKVVPYFRHFISTLSYLLLSLVLTVVNVAWHNCDMFRDWEQQRS